MFLSEQEIELPTFIDQRNLLSQISQSLAMRLPEDAAPVRFVITQTHGNLYRCEVGIATGVEQCPDLNLESIFSFRKRRLERVNAFNTVFLVPTGIGSEIGGHAGDSTPAARILASISDRLITHPNVVNASDINELPENGLYVEGSIICRLLMGTIGLQPVRANRVLVVIDANRDEEFKHAAINSVGASRAALGLACPRVVEIDPPKLEVDFAKSGRAAGRVEGLANLFQVLQDHRQEYDAVAISSLIDVPYNYHLDYFTSRGAIINPWGGVEAMLTHLLSSLFDVPSAHSPMFESKEIANLDPGVVDPRMAAEAVSTTFLQCTLKGLQRSPRIVKDPDSIHHRGVLSAADIACLVIPNGCLGLPTLAALEQGIPVVAVKENQNIMKNDLSALPWSEGQFYLVENYWEAAGVLACLKAGVTPESIRRPLSETTIETAASKARRQLQANGESEYTSK